MANSDRFAELFLNYNPEEPQARFKTAGVKGALKSMSWQFYATYADEAYAVLSTDFLKAGKTPEGFDLAQLKADLADIEKVPSSRASIIRRRS